MKINVEVDATPEEIRAFLGLPDVAPLQKEMMEDVAKRMREGQQGYESLAMMQPLMQSGVANMDAMQKLFWQAFTQSGSKDDNKK
ncbi:MULTISPECIES: DUF6489 family protein [Ectothiorhodospira]|uniref:Ribosomal protein S1 n=1 Tax=Ectothiorhodospira haloalkaliphila TaxID=421628 RepID=W8KM98_9GAMM|nr:MULTISPECIES: DUF6489 family protein [Ectothiorhodospira]TVQ73123.1 MAG: hypothetical protein EA372_06020 [Chromatiaceae bacterium]AHK80303.1 hypothetical protein M911_15380 [Ectothiorhodospira haloalkaliphila]ANB01408.1 hypothetical protein ECTOBSL9_0513 [Ectothiorhodospira sp. BSL-9]MCG5493501.1 DUF6489 family protein [Ectothiorhodospira variabilis]MCG5496847.1 DUF6489 family protein [Ectothiorhodospira variabilis]